jgi:hypothetical protein
LMICRRDKCKEDIFKGASTTHCLWKYHNMQSTFLYVCMHLHRSWQLITAYKSQLSNTAKFTNKTEKKYKPLNKLFQSRILTYFTNTHANIHNLPY